MEIFHLSTFEIRRSGEALLIFIYEATTNLPFENANKSK